ARLLRRSARPDRGAARTVERGAELFPEAVSEHRVSEPLRLGLVGCGSIARAHAAALRFLTHDGLVRVTAAADPDPEGIDQVAKILGGIEHTGADGYAVIDHDEVDAVVNITPTRFHRDYMAAVARAGKPCFAEK